MRKVTVQDIANTLNLSVGTVYRSLNNTGRVSEKTKKLVLDYAEQVGFQPNSIAQGLAKRKKFRILVLLLNAYTEWWDSVDIGVRKAAEELYEFGVEVTTLRYSLPLSDQTPASSTDTSLGLVEKIQNNEVDGIILVPSINREIVTALDLARAKGIPVVCVNADVPLSSQRLFYYGPDEEKVGNTIGELICKLIGARGTLLLVSRESTDFYRTALRKKGLYSQVYRYYTDVNIRQCTVSSADLADQFKVLLKQSGEEISAVYVDDSTVLKDVAQVIKDLDMRSIVVVGHECLPGCESLLQEGWITATLCQETFSQGYYPLKLLYHYLLSGAKPESHYYSNVNIIFRSNADLLNKREHGCGFL